MVFSIDVGPISFNALGSFSAGGVFSGTGSHDRVNLISTLMGSWKRNGPNLFRWGLVRYGSREFVLRGGEVSFIAVSEIASAQAIRGTIEASSCVL
jgi:hypothetical protein